MITMFAARLLCVLVVLAPVVLVLQPTQAAAQAQLAPMQRVPSYAEQQEKINAWTVGLAAGLIEGAPLRLATEMARVVDDGAIVASSCTLARIGPNGPVLCCSKLKPSAYGPYGVSIGFWSRTGKSFSRFAFSGRLWLLM